MVQLALSEKLGQLLHAPTAADDKYSRGVVGFITGSDDYPGASLLGIRAALAISVGMVKYVGPQRVQDLLLVSHPEVVCFDLTSAAGRANAWVLGSGVPVSDAKQRRNIELLFLSSGALAIIDAGALEFLDFNLLKNHRLLLTPHYSELARLLNRLDETREHNAESVRDNARELALQAALKTGHCVLLKGNITYLASPTGELREIGPNSSHLATAGTGDVLAGLLGAIAAQNSENSEWLDIAEVSVRLHSAAADLAAEAGQVSASSVVDALGVLFRKLVS